MTKITPLFIVVALFLSSCASLTADSHTKKYFQDPQVLQLATAAAHGDIGKIDALKTAGVDINSVGYNGVTPLLWALVQGNKAGYEELLKLGANPNHVDDDHEAAIILASEMVDSDFLRITLAHGGDPNLLIPDGSPHTPLIAAIGPGGFENVKLLVKAGADVNYASPVDGTTPATDAAGLNQYDIVYYLLQNGANYAAEVKTYQGPKNGLVWTIENNNIDPNSQLYQWREKVIEFLGSKGLTVNPKIP